MSNEVMNDAQRCRSCGVELPEGVFRCERCLTSERLLLSHLTSPLPSQEATPGNPVFEAGIDFGDYVLLNEIARGGMGRVHRARQKSLNRVVAIKRPLPGVAADEECVRRFRIEAEAVAALSHPNIIPVFECGEWNGEQYFSMAYVEGCSLIEVVRTKAVAPAQAARYVQKIAQAIHHAHQRGVLHRDLKPGNIIIDASDEPRVADFGIAQLLRGGDETEAMRAGTPHFMAPEQMQPESKRLSVATDVYALGGILYHLLTGLPPFQGDTRDAVLWSAYYDEPVPPALRNPAVNRDLEAICLKALEKDPDRRYGSAQAMAEDLESFLEGRPVAARPVGAIKRFCMWVRRNPIVAGLLLLLAVALAAGLVLQLLAFRKVRTARAASEGFIGFMNGDLVHDLRDAGRLDLMEKVNAKAEDYYTNHTAVGDAGYWGRKAVFYENTAEVERDLGHLGEAERRAVEAEGIYRRQAHEEPREARWRRDLSRVRMMRLGIAKLSGLRHVANDHGEAAVAFASEALEPAPGDPTNRANLANVLLEQASFWIEQKRTEAPSTNISRADSILREVAALPAASPEWSLWLASCSYYRGLVRQLRRDPAGSLNDFNDYRDAMEALVKRFPQNTRWQYELTVAYSRVGEALFHLRQFTEAQAYVNVFTISASNLTQLDPRNTSWLSLYGRSLIWQGTLAMSLDPAGSAARDFFRTSLAVQSNLVLRNPDWDRWLDGAVRSTRSLAGWHWSHGQKEEAVSILNGWRRQCEERATSRLDHVGHQMRWGDAVVAEASMVGRKDGPERQMALLREFLERFEDPPPSRPDALAKARVLSRVAQFCAETDDHQGAARHLQEALHLRLSYFERSPLVAEVREHVSDNFAYAVEYLVAAGDPERATSLAEEGLDWASKHLFPEEWRTDYARMCSLLIKNGESPGAALVERTRRLLDRCLSERLVDPPALSAREQEYAERLREWLIQHP